MDRWRRRVHPVDRSDRAVIGVTYRVVLDDGTGYDFRSTMVDEMAWESYAAKHNLPIMPKQGRDGVDMSGFPLGTNGAVLAWSHAKHQRGETAGLDAYAARLVSVLPGVDTADTPDPTQPAPGAGS